MALIYQWLIYECHVLREKKDQWQVVESGLRLIVDYFVVLHLFFLIKGYPSNPVKITKSDQVWLFKKSKLRRQWWHFISMPMNVSLGLASRIFWDCIILLFYSSTNFISDNDPLIQLFDRFERTSLEKNSDFKISFKYFK